MKKKTIYTILIIILILVILSLCFIYYYKEKETTINTINNNSKESIEEKKKNNKETQNNEEDKKENQSNEEDSNSITKQEEDINSSNNIEIPKDNKTTVAKEITIIDESKNANCASAIEYYYEDTNYKYYFTCIKSGSIFVMVNGSKYNIKEALNNKIVTIAELEEAGFKPLKEEKNTQKY